MKKTLVIGATPNPERYAYLATEMLKKYGHEVVAFGIRKGEINGTVIVNDFPTTTDFDTVTLYLNPNNQTSLEQQVIDLHPKRVVFNPGTENPDFEKRLKEHGIEALEACTLVLLRTTQY